MKNRLLDRLAASMAVRGRDRIAAELLAAPRVFGPIERLSVDPTAKVNDTLFNLSSGYITVGPWAMLAHHVCLLTGTHDITQFDRARQLSAPREGRDIVVEEGAWLASNVTVLGPARIGRHAVIGAGSLVRGDVPAFAIAVGIPARVVGEVKHTDQKP